MHLHPLVLTSLRPLLLLADSAISAKSTIAVLSRLAKLAIVVSIATTAHLALAEQKENTIYLGLQALRTQAPLTVSPSTSAPASNTILKPVLGIAFTPHWGLELNMYQLALNCSACGLKNESFSFSQDYLSAMLTWTFVSYETIDFTSKFGISNVSASSKSNVVSASGTYDSINQNLLLPTAGIEVRYQMLPFMRLILGYEATPRLVSQYPSGEFTSNVSGLALSLHFTF